MPSQEDISSRRVPSSLLNSNHSTSCFSQLVPVLREGSLFSDESITAQSLERRGLLDLMDYDDFRTNAQWKEVVGREGMSERDEDLGYMALSLIKKEHPGISDEGLKDRYEVLLHFCGGSH